MRQFVLQMKWSVCITIALTTLLVLVNQHVNALVLQAYQRNDPVEVDRLLGSYRAFTNGEEGSERSLVTVSSAHGQTEMLRVFLEHGGNPNTASLWGDTPLIAATRAAASPCVSLLLRSGADPNLRNPFDGDTALIAAAEKEDTAITSILLDHHASVNLRNKSGYTALKMARLSDDKPSHSVITLLKRAGECN